MKFLFKFSVGFIIFIFVFYFVFLSERNKSLENDPAVKQWIGKDFEIKKGIYILKYDDDRSGRHHLVLPDDTIFPSSVEEFLEDPGAWFFCRDSWCRPVMPGSHFRLLKIYKHIKPAVVELLNIEAVMLDGDHKKVKLEIRDLFNYNRGTFQVLGPKEDFIEVLN